ncbi:MAG: segregation/condensation protein A [Clostridiales bacterium]|nr:segregation/condensation protein A [Clostridiales bacterium]
MNQPAHQLRLEVFEGPFELLIHLIDKNQLDIYDIPIAEITRQYLEYLQAMEELDLEIASSFLVMAARLLLIKARLLLPVPPADELTAEDDGRQELVHDLLEYLRFKEAAKILDQCFRQEGQYVARPNEEALYTELFAEENPLDGKTLLDLANAFQEALNRLPQAERVMNIVREEVTINDKIKEISKKLTQAERSLPFREIFTLCRSKIEMVITFLALLELARQKRIRISQRNAFGEIYIRQVTGNR